MQGIGIAGLRGRDGSVQFPGFSQPTGLVVLDGAMQEIVHTAYPRHRVLRGAVGIYPRRSQKAGGSLFRPLIRPEHAAALADLREVAPHAGFLGLDHRDEARGSSWIMRSIAAVLSAASPPASPRAWICARTARVPLHDLVGGGESRPATARAELLGEALGLAGEARLLAGRRHRARRCQRAAPGCCARPRSPRGAPRSSAMTSRRTPSLARSPRVRCEAMIVVEPPEIRPDVARRAAVQRVRQLRDDGLRPRDPRGEGGDVPGRGSLRPAAGR